MVSYDGNVLSVVPPPLNRYLRTIRSFHPTHTIFNHLQPLGRHIRRPRSDLDLICPSSRHCPRREWLPLTFTHLTVIMQRPILLAILINWVLPLGYSHATRKSYTQISPLHGKEDCWHFRGVYRLPHPYLTRIQRRLLIVASITPPTHMLPLIAIVNAPHLEFGGSPLYTASVALTAQQLSTSILVSLLWLFQLASQHTGFVHLHWVLIIRIDLVEISTAARRRLSWCHKKGGISAFRGRCRTSKSSTID